MSNKTVYGIGNVLIDILTDVTDKDLQTLGLDKGIMKLVDDSERTAILKHIENHTINYNCGGSAPNTIINLAAIGVSSALSGKVGQDDFGETYINNLKELGVTSYISESQGEATGSSIVLITPDSERTMNTTLCCNQTYSVENINPEAIAEADYFFFTGYMWDTEPQKKALLEAIEIAKANNTKIAFDVADPFAVNRNREEFLHLIENHFDIAFANAEEARLLYGDIGIEACANKLSEIADIAVVKNGKEGSIVKMGSESYSIPVNKVKAIDTTGAGDMYAAGFLGGLCKGMSLKDSGIFASWLASQVVQDWGAQLSSDHLKRVRSQIADGSWNFTKS